MISESNWSMERDAFLSSPAPRRVPPAILKKVLGKPGSWLPVLLGAIFIIVGSLFCAVFAPRHTIDEWRLKHGTAQTALGRITAAEKTPMQENGSSVWKHAFAFKDEAGVERKGDAYLTGSKWKSGSRVTVTYLASDPSVARVKGARMDKVSAPALFVLLFPIAGAAMLIGAWWSRSSKKRLLTYGVIGTAKVSTVEPTSMTVNGQTLHKIRLIRTDDGTEIVRRTVDDGEINLAMRKRESGETLPILYDPKKPRRVMFPDSWSDTGGFAVVRYFQGNPGAETATKLAPEIQAFLDMPPPRRIPRALAKKVSLGMMLWFFTIFGSVFLGFGLLALSAVFPWHQLDEWKLESGPSKTVAGRIVGASDSGMKIDHEAVVEYAYVYQPDGGEELTGKAFARGLPWERGTQVEVSYLEKDPRLAVPLGARLGRGSFADLWVLLFPAIGATTLLIPWIIRHRRRHLLRHGQRGMARVSAFERTAVTVNREPQFAIHLTREDGTAMIRKTHARDEVALAARKLRDGEPAIVLFDPLKPDRLILPEGW